MRKLKLIGFWIVALTVIIWHTLKGNEWHIIYADFHLGDDKEGNPIRKQLIAKKQVSGMTIYWQNPRA